MPAIARFFGKFPESADYRVAGIVSHPRRIHGKERSFNFVVFGMKMERECCGREASINRLVRLRPGNVQILHIAFFDDCISARQEETRFGQNRAARMQPGLVRKTRKPKTQTTFSSTVGSTYSRYNSRSLSFCSFPVAVCGSSSAKTTSSGFHHFATLPS